MIWLTIPITVPSILNINPPEFPWLSNARKVHRVTLETGQSRFD